MITKLKEYLYEIKKDYLNDAAYLGMVQITMTDHECKKVDAEAEAFMKKCKDAINELTMQVGSKVSTRQSRENKACILEIINKYLLSVCKIYSQQKAIRMKRIIDKNRIARLQPELSVLPAKPLNKCKF